ncbi:hypothetical protein RYX36_007358, partial [Vicia faba]
VRVGLPKKNPKVLKPAFTIPPKLLQSLVEDPKWDEKGSVTQNYNSFGVVNDPNSLIDSLRAPPFVSDDPNDSGSDLEEDDLKSALGKRRRDGKSALPQPLTLIQRLYISRLVEKYGADFQHRSEKGESSIKALGQKMLMEMKSPLRIDKRKMDALLVKRCYKK